MEKFDPIQKAFSEKVGIKDMPRPETANRMMSHEELEKRKRLNATNPDKKVSVR